MDQFLALVLVSDKNFCLKSRKPNYEHKILGKSVFEYVKEAVEMSGIRRHTELYDLNGELAKNPERYLFSNVPDGIGEKYIIILRGDMPLITASVISDIIGKHSNSENAATMAVIGREVEFPSVKDLKNAAGFGELYLSDNLSQEAGIFCFSIKDFFNVTRELEGIENFDEAFLIKVIERMIKKGLKTEMLKIRGEELLRVTDRIKLSEATEILKRRIIRDLMRKGVTFIDPASTHIDSGVTIGMDTVIYPGTILEGKTIIGEDCIVGPYSRIESSNIGNSVEIKNSVIIDSIVMDETRVGPFAYIRPGSEIGERVKIGDFVEIKKSKIGNETSVAHLTYIGDAEVGNNVNMGCGVVVVNYDGENKHKTIVEDNAFVGCNVNLVSPVTVRKNSFIAAGSTITEEVPENSLAIARNRQEVKKDWVTKRKSGKQ